MNVLRMTFPFFLFLWTFTAPIATSQDASALRGPLYEIAKERYSAQAQQFEGHPELMQAVAAYEKSFPDRELTPKAASALAVVGGIVLQKAPDTIELRSRVIQDLEFSIDEDRKRVELTFLINRSPVKLKVEAALIPLATKFVVDQRPVLLTLAADYPQRKDFATDPDYAAAILDYAKRSDSNRLAVNPAIARSSLVVDALRIDFKLGSLVNSAPAGTTHFVLIEEPWELDTKTFESRFNQFKIMTRGTLPTSRTNVDLSRQWEDKFAVQDFQSLNRLRKFIACRKLIYALLSESTVGISPNQFTELLDATQAYYDADELTFHQSGELARLLAN